MLGKHRAAPPPIPPGGTVACINIQNLLRAWHSSVKRASRRKRGKPERKDKLAIVSYAAEFFRRHSPHRLSTDPDSHFCEFAGRFFEAVTGIEVSPDLEWQIRRVLKNRMLEVNRQKKPI
jgi:hypothetical protein